MNNNIRLIKGDCLEEMDKLIEEKKIFDLILCDPPYGKIEGLKIDGYKGHNANTTWDTTINPKDIFQRAEKLLRENGILILFSQEPYTSQLITQSTTTIEFCYRYVWEKNNFANCLGCKKAPVSYIEDVCIFYKKYDTNFSNPLRKYSKNVLNYIKLNMKQINKKLNNRKTEHFFYWNTFQFGLCTEEAYNQLINNFNIDKMEGFLNYEELKEINDKYKKLFNLYGESKKSNILEYKKESKRYHPTQKPVLLLEDLIKTYTNEGDNVLDFTMGSGSTGVACINTNREFIGIERDDKYFDIACDRINELNKDT